MPSGFVENPGFVPDVEAGLLRAIDDAGEEIKNIAISNIAPYSSSAAAAIKKERAVPTADGPAVTVRIGKGLGPIFEFSKQGQRHTRKGANRGVMQRREFFHSAVNAVLTRGLDLARYL